MIKNHLLSCSAATISYGYWPHFHGTRRFYNKEYYTHSFGKEMGDVLFSKLKPFDQFGVKPGNSKIYWAPGNHENWDELDKYGNDIFEIQDNVFYMPFGSTITLPDGRVVLFCGKAASVDWKTRTLGETWWKQETIQTSDMDNLPDIHVDIVISHTVPKQWHDIMLEYDSNKFNDPSIKALEMVFNKYKPSLWYSGHWHCYKHGEWDGCEWHSLNMEGNGGNWWKWIKD